MRCHRFPLHNPDDRIALAGLDHGWQVRAFAPNDQRFVYCVPRGMFHLQLWHERDAISILTPSRLTCEQFELWLGETRRRFSTFGELAAVLSAHGHAPPDEDAVRYRIKTEVDELVAWLCPIPLTTFRGGRA